MTDSRSTPKASSSGWYGVRCVVECGRADDEHLYEERITVWRAQSLDHAIELAEAEARVHARTLDSQHLGLAQAYQMADDLTQGAEVFSLIRRSRLEPREYIDTFFDTGTESQIHHDEVG
jgi:hypothetical protein